MRQASAYKRNVYGYGLTIPFRRTGGRDFAASDGAPLLASCIAQLLSTRPGELPWKPEFGIDLERYRHKNLSQNLGKQLCEEIVTAITTFEPRVTITSCSARSEGTVLYVTVGWAVFSAAPAGSNVIIGPVTQEVLL